MKLHDGEILAASGNVFRAGWMLAGFAAALLIGDMFLAVRGASPRSVEFLFGVAGFSLAQICWTVAQLREARPDWRVFSAVAVPLALFVLVRLRPPVLSASVMAAVCAYSALTALSFAMALATRRAFYVCGIGLLLFSDLMIGFGLLRMPGCKVLIGPAYIVAELCLIVSFLWRGERRISVGRVSVRWWAIGLGVAGSVCFIAAMAYYPGGGYNPLMKMLSALGRTEVRKVAYPPCHYLFMAGMALSAASVAGVWGKLLQKRQDVDTAYAGWRGIAMGWGGAANVAGLLAIMLVPENVNMFFHNFGCYLATFGGVAILAARFRKGADLAWTCWFVALVTVFAVCVYMESIPFCPYVTATQKLLILSFAAWVGWIAWRESVVELGESGE